MPLCASFVSFVANKSNGARTAKLAPNFSHHGNRNQSQFQFSLRRFVHSAPAGLSRARLLRLGGMREGEAEVGNRTPPFPPTAQRQCDRTGEKPVKQFRIRLELGGVILRLAFLWAGDRRGRPGHASFGRWMTSEHLAYAVCGIPHAPVVGTLRW